MQVKKWGRIIRAKIIAAKAHSSTALARKIFTAMSFCTNDIDSIFDSKIFVWHPLYILKCLMLIGTLKNRSGQKCPCQLL